MPPPDAGTPPAPAPAPAPPPVAACPLCHLEIVDAAGAVLTGTQTHVVGQRIELRVRASPGGGMTNIQWTLPGNPIKDYPQTVASASVTNLTPADLASADASAASVRFYWIAALASGNVQVSATVSGATLTASLPFVVLAPTGVSFTGEQCETTLGPHFLYALGVQAYNAATGHFGVQWNATCTAPAGGDGQIAITQLITRNFTRTIGGTNQHITPPLAVLDDGLGIQYSGPQPITASHSATLSGNAYADSPGSALVAGVTVTNVGDGFTDYFMYKPSTPGSIWVTLSVLAWSWNAAATAAPPPPPPPPPSGFILGAHAPTSVTTQTGSASTTLPVWTANLAPYNHWTT